MNKQSMFEKLVYVVVGVIFFVGYYFLAKEVIKFDPFRSCGLIPTIYFGICILCFPVAGEIISQNIKNSLISSKLVMPLAYIFAPIICFFKKK